ncbi:MAG: hypothetical protein MHM6MM_002361 [Cercozoa sp. M6MM]
MLVARRSVLARFTSSQRFFAAPALDFDNSEAACRGMTTGEVARAWFVLRVCGLPGVVKHSRALYENSRKFFGDNITDAFLKATFFGHFCGGETAEEVRETAHRLRKSGIGTIVDYAAEADIDAAEGKTDMSESDALSRLYDANTDLFIECVDTAAQAACDDANAIFAAVKVTALASPAALMEGSAAINAARELFCKLSGGMNEELAVEVFKQKVTFPDELVGELVDHFFGDSETIEYVDWKARIDVTELENYPSAVRKFLADRQIEVSDEVVHALNVCRQRAARVAHHAKEKNVRVFVDAEQSQFQPAIDAVTQSLMAEFNTESPVVYSTHQAYLQRTRGSLQQDMLRARKQNYHFATKLVRGAYLEWERSQGSSYHAPCVSLQQTHQQYDECAALVCQEIVERKGKASLMLATHNKESLQKIVTLAKETSATLGQVGASQHIFTAQLLGMADALTAAVAQEGSLSVYKYVPYGPIHEVLPYLLRRIAENGDVVTGGAAAQAQLLQRELLRRMTPL